MTREEAQALIAAIQTLRASATDEQALTAVEVYPSWRADEAYSAADRVRYAGKLYKCLTSHTAQEAWKPDSAPSLWAEVLAGQGGTDIGEWVQPDSTNPYMIGDKVRYQGLTYVSTIDNNVWMPTVYGWDEV